MVEVRQLYVVSVACACACAFVLGLALTMSTCLPPAGDPASPAVHPREIETTASLPRPSQTGERSPGYAQRLTGLYPARALRVIDGDTVEMRVSIWLGQEVVTRVRMRGIDAPELRARCREELTQAEAAKAALQAMVETDSLYVTDVGYDKYGTRVVARIVDAAHVDLGARLLEAKLARPYTGGKRQSWCEMQQTR